MEILNLWKIHWLWKFQVCGKSIGCGNSKFMENPILLTVGIQNLLTKCQFAVCKHLLAFVASTIQHLLESMCCFMYLHTKLLSFHHSLPSLFSSPSLAKLYRSTRTNQTFYMCRRRGHLARNCPAGAGLPRGTLMICVHCGTPGHLGWECHLFNRLKRKLILPRNAQEDK